ncbi:hypothetical protein P3X46_023214 [Hevea brasiliensis]|uniref:Calmodulin-binding domain-containing protein n=1 Tax=Hevea brasiliensis TaxID=3981 RepID=A0ABQ9LAE1_HEVBR|nr:uncharacterized protein LOC110639203 [Hevea brasiliensis]KAJ9163563.1 hypothetical protein P3X46_023214 [Hevea brasiliensis]
MTEEKIYAIPEHDPTPMIPASDSLLVIQESDSISLIPETYSASVVPESDTPVVLEGTEPKDGHVQRYSAGNIGIPYKSVKILSRYLAASTGSCHDYCKYGQRQDLETKTTSNSILETIMERQGEGQDMGKVLTLGERKKKLAVNYVSSRGSGIQNPDIPVISKKEVSSSGKKDTVLLKQRSLPVKEVDTRSRPVLLKSPSLPIKEHLSSKEYGEIQENKSSTKKETVLLKKRSLPVKEVDARLRPMLPKSPSLRIKEHLSGKEYGEIQENKEMGTSLVTSYGASSSREQTELGRANEMKNSVLDGKKVLAQATASSLYALHSVKKVFTRPIASLSPKRSEKRVSNMNTEKFKSLKGVSHLKDRSNVGKAESEQPSNESVPEKTSHVTELNTENKALTQHSDRSPSLSSFHRDKNLKHDQKRISPVQLSLPFAGKILRRTQCGIHVSRSPKFSESKSLRLNKRGIHVAGSSISSLSSSKSNHDGTFSEDPETSIDNIVNAKVEPRNKPRNRGVVKTKDTDSPARKLTFRKGKVLELPPVISSPRRLKFRRRNLIDSQIGKVEATESTIKNTEICVDEGDPNVGKSKSKKVVLKRKDVKGQKVEQNLLNDMIEETANKLAKSRKSKVKALVGAFETVISLQDPKPLSTVDAC